MVSSASLYSAHLNVVSHLFGKPSPAKVRVKPTPPPAATLAKRKIQQLAPTFANLTDYSPQQLNNCWSAYLEQVSKELLALPDLHKPELRDPLKKVLESLEMKNLELFFERLAKADIEKPSSKAVEELLKLIDVKKVESCLKSKNPHFKGAKDWAADLGAVFSSGKPIAVQAVKAQNVVTRFFPNLGRVLSRAFSIFDSDRPPSTLYEYGVIITMYLQLFIVPYILFKGLSALIASTTTVILTVTLILGLAVGALYVYMRWIKKCPKQVIFCENLSEQHRQRQLHPVVGREAEFRQAIACLNNARRGTVVNLLIVGEPGVGKTEFMNGLAQRLSNREVFKFKNGALYGAPNGFQSPAEKVEEAFREVKGYEEQVVFMHDELGDTKEPAFLKPILNNKNIPLIAALTQKQYEELKKTDPALEERFKPIFLKPLDKKQTLQILNERMRTHAPDISYSQGALGKIFEVSEKSGYCQPRKAISLLDELINQIHQFKVEEYATPKYWAALQALKGVQAQGAGFDSPLRHPFSKECLDYLAEREKAQNAVIACEVELWDKKHQAKKMRELGRQEREIQRKLEVNLKPISLGKGGEAKIRRFLFETFFVYPRLGELVEDMAKGLNADMPLRLDVALVEKVDQENQAHLKP